MMWTRGATAGWTAVAVAAVMLGTPDASAAQTVWTLPSTVTFNQPTAADFNAGFIGEPAMGVVVFSFGGRPWQLYMRAAVPDMGGYGKPISDVLWRTQGSTAWTPLSTGFQKIAEGTGFTIVWVYFRTRLQWSLDVAGTYDAVLEFGTTQS